MHSLLRDPLNQAAVNAGDIKTKNMHFKIKSFQRPNVCRVNDFSIVTCLLTVVQSPQYQETSRNVLTRL